jgi:hypothetical protein
VKTLALLSLYSPPDHTLLHVSAYTLWSSTFQQDADLRIVPVKTITSVVVMVPHYPFPDSVGRFFVTEKIGFDVAHMGGDDQELTEE